MRKWGGFGSLVDFFFSEADSTPPWPKTAVFPLHFLTFLALSQSMKGVVGSWFLVGSPTFTLGEASLAHPSYSRPPVATCCSSLDCTLSQRVSHNFRRLRSECFQFIVVNFVVVSLLLADGPQRGAR